MKVLCTGGAGYVGSACVRFLLSQGHDVCAYDNLSSGNRGAVPDFERRLVVGDIMDAELLSRTLRERQIDIVMHFAALIDVGESEVHPQDYWEVNFVGTKRVVDAMLSQGVQRLVFSSTAAVYGASQEMPLTESSATLPENVYGQTKLACEQLLADYSKGCGLGYTTFRYFNASGADEDGEHGEYRKKESHLVPLALQTAVGVRQQLSVFGEDWPTADGTCVRDYVHVWDIAQAHGLGAETLQPGQGRTYNLGSSTGTSVLEVIRACEAASDRKVNWQGAPRRPGDPAVLVASSERVRSELAWQPRFQSAEAIVASAYRWHQRYPNGYADKIS